MSWCDILVWFFLAGFSLRHLGLHPTGHCHWFPEGRLKGREEIYPLARTLIGQLTYASI